MSFPLAYSALRWENPNLEQTLVQLREAGWDGWEARQSLDWLGSARRVSQICDAVGIQVAAICGPNVTLDVTHPTHEINKRRIEFASDLEGSYLYDQGGRDGLESETTDLDLDRMAAVYDDLAAYGEPLGVTVTFHPPTGHVVDSADEWKRFMTRAPPMSSLSRYVSCCPLGLRSNSSGLRLSGSHLLRPPSRP